MLLNFLYALCGTVVIAVALPLLSFWLHWCTGSFRLASKLKSLEEYLGVCEINSIEYNQLFEEVQSIYVHVYACGYFVKNPFVTL